MEEDFYQEPYFDFLDDFRELARRSSSYRGRSSRSRSSRRSRSYRSSYSYYSGRPRRSQNHDSGISNEAIAAIIIVLIVLVAGFCIWLFYGQRIKAYFQRDFGITSAIKDKWNSATAPSTAPI